MSSWSPQRPSSRRFDQSVESGPLVTTCLQIVDLGIGAIIFVGPHLFGGRHPLGRFAILSLCVITAMAWFTRQFCLKNPKWYPTWPMGLLLTACAWLVLQLTPLPSGWLDKLSPRIAEILPLWTSSASSTALIGPWKTLSLCPEDTRLALAALISYGLLFVTVVQRIENVDDVKRLFRWIATSAVIVATFGIVQYFTSNGKFFWFYEHPYTDTLSNIKGGFSSRNHFAHFVVLGLTTMFSWLMLLRTSTHHKLIRGAQSSRRFDTQRSSPPKSLANLCLIIGIVVSVFAVVACLSRGGLLAMGSATLISVLFFARLRLIDTSVALFGSLVMVAIVATLSISGDYDDVAKRMETLTSQSMDELDSSGGRRLIWSANIAAIRAGWLTGAGAGTHRFIYPAYMNQSFSTEFTHAENGYLQVATENGLPGIIFLVVVTIACVSWCFQCLGSTDHDIQILGVGIAAALSASLVHSIVDFVWFIPACLTLTVILAGCALRLSQITCSSRQTEEAFCSVSKTSSLNWTLGTCLAGIWVVITLFPLAKSSLAWDRYALARQATDLAATKKLQVNDQLRDQLEEMEQLNIASQFEYLAAVVRDYPNSASAQIQLATALLNQFERESAESGNAMSISQIREAAQCSQFGSAQELRDWLNIAFGKSALLLYRAHFHARRALKLCPLQAEAYISLAELCFLEGKGTSTYNAYVHQGLIVNPTNPTHLFGAGKNYYIAGDRQQAFRLWQTAYSAPGRHQRHIIEILVHELPARQFLEKFSPNWTSLETLWQAYASLGSIEDLQAILHYATKVTATQSTEIRPHLAAKAWLALSGMQFQLSEPQAALNSLQQAYKCFPDSFPIRHELGRCLLAFQQFELAETHLRWCASQAPDNRTLQAELLQANRGKVTRLTQATAQKY